jgi:uncharacterized YigZ family protein
VISKSRFLGYCFPVDSEAAAAKRLAEIRKKHWDARHVCYAFRIAAGVSRSSDDGEPSGTAGAPILNALMKNGAENVLCAVVRYFGGVLLGTGGLVRAYTKAATLALQSAGALEMRVCSKTEICVSYASYAALEPLLRASGIPFAAEYGEAVTLTCTVPAENAERFAGDVTERTDGSARIRPLGEGLCPLEHDGTHGRGPTQDKEQTGHETVVGYLRRFPMHAAVPSERACRGGHGRYHRDAGRS